VLEGRALPSTLRVLNTLDSGSGSLRDTIAAAASGDTIKFDSSVFGQTITLNQASGRLDVNKNLDIEGPVGNPIVISGNDATKVFLIFPGTVVTLSGLTITKGSADFRGQGGGILNDGTLTISHCTLSGNHADIGGTNGGGIYNNGTLTVSQCMVSGNHADFDGANGGGIYNDTGAMLTISQSTLSDNRAVAGGGIANFGTLTVSQSTLSKNTAGVGGGIFNLGGTVTVSHSTLFNNTAVRGGGIVNASIVNVGIDIFGTLTLDHSTVFNNTANEGGGIFNDTGATLNLNHSSVTGNTPDDVDNDGTLNQDHSTIGILD
jgi:hypothetical protein